jgi:WD40 repeat protein
LTNQQADILRENSCPSGKNSEIIYLSSELGLVLSHQRFLLYQEISNNLLIHDLAKGDKHELTIEDWFPANAAISPDGTTVALANSRNSRAGWVRVPIAPPSKSWWGRFTEWLGIKEEEPPECTVTLKNLATGEETDVLENCPTPVFSPDGGTLAVTGADGTSVQLWDFPIRKSMGRIAGLVCLAALTVLLAFQGLRLLKGRRSAR